MEREGEREREGEGEGEGERISSEVGHRGLDSDVCAERKALECLLVDGGFVHGENW